MLRVYFCVYQAVNPDKAPVLLPEPIPSSEKWRMTPTPALIASLLCRCGLLASCGPGGRRGGTVLSRSG